MVIKDNVILQGEFSSMERLQKIYKNTDTHIFSYVKQTILICCFDCAFQSIYFHFVAQSSHKFTSQMNPQLQVHVEMTDGASQMYIPNMYKQYFCNFWQSYSRQFFDELIHKKNHLETSYHIDENREENRSQFQLNWGQIQLKPLESQITPHCQQPVNLESNIQEQGQRTDEQWPQLSINNANVQKTIIQSKIVQSECMNVELNEEENDGLKLIGQSKQQLNLQNCNDDQSNREQIKQKQIKCNIEEDKQNTQTQQQKEELFKYEKYEEYKEYEQQKYQRQQKKKEQQEQYEQEKQQKEQKEWKEYEGYEEKIKKQQQEQQEQQKQQKEYKGYEENEEQEEYEQQEQQEQQEEQEEQEQQEEQNKQNQQVQQRQQLNQHTEQQPNTKKQQIFNSSQSNFNSQLIKDIYRETQQLQNNHHNKIYSILVSEEQQYHSSTVIPQPEQQNYVDQTQQQMNIKESRLHDLSQPHLNISKVAQMMQKQQAQSQIPYNPTINPNKKETIKFSLLKQLKYQQSSEQRHLQKKINWAIEDFIQYMDEEGDACCPQCIKFVHQNSNLILLNHQIESEKQGILLKYDFLLKQKNIVHQKYEKLISTNKRSVERYEGKIGELQAQIKRLNLKMIQQGYSSLLKSHPKIKRKYTNTASVIINKQAQKSIFSSVNCYEQQPEYDESEKNSSD